MMKHLILASALLSSVAMAAPDKPGGGPSPADEARAKAQEARDKQAADEKAKAEKAAQGGDKPGAAPEGDAVKDGLAPATDVEGLDPKSAASRIDALERLVATLTAQTAGNTGPALDEAKGIEAASPGAGFDPRMVRPLPAGVSSAPSTQPMPLSNGGTGGVDAVGGSALWGSDAKGGPVQARAYPGLEEEDVVVTATGYHDDTIRNAGDILKGYTGPASSWFVPVGLVKKLGSGEDAAREWRKKLTDFAVRAAA
jgi:hypothetical protein